MRLSAETREIRELGFKSVKICKGRVQRREVIEDLF